MPNRRLFACCLLCLLPSAAALRGQLRGDVDRQSLLLPAVGDSTLRILSPSLLELTLISRAAKGPPEAPSFGVTVGGIRAEVAAVGAKRRVAYAPLAHSDLRIATEFYLRLAVPLALQDPARKVEVRAPADGRASTAVVASAACDPLRTSPGDPCEPGGLRAGAAEKGDDRLLPGRHGRDGSFRSPPASTLIDAGSGAVGLHREPDAPRRTSATGPARRPTSRFSWRTSAPSRPRASIGSKCPGSAPRCPS